MTRILVTESIFVLLCAIGSTLLIWAGVSLHTTLTLIGGGIMGSGIAGLYIDPTDWQVRVTGYGPDRQALIIRSVVAFGVGVLFIVAANFWYPRISN